jgi:formylglycine-generating enzyme required for sulfatase activity
MNLSFGILTVCAVTQVAAAQPSPDGFDWVTIGAPANAAYDRRDPNNLITGRGSVDYSYQLGRTEVTTAQWLEFINAALARPDPLPLDITRPVIWGAQLDPTYSGPGLKYRLASGVENAANLAAGGIPWRTGAVFCNWLHNNKATNPEAFMNGAYDASTFGYLDNDEFTDQVAHNPDARYWIPTLDEWLKGAYYDPNKDGVGGWWLSPNGTDDPIQYGPPGVGDANAGYTLPGQAEFRIPLGSYPQTASPWGLLDLSGFTTEFTESIFVDPFDPGNHYRLTGGSYWTNGWVGGDFPSQIGAALPSETNLLLGFRFATSIPSPSAACVATATFAFVNRRRRKHS